MNCIGKMIKYILYIANIVFVACGIFLITLGSIMLSNLDDYSSDDVANSQTLPILILCLGCIVFVTSFFGCCGAIKENICLLKMYSIIMFVLFCLQFALVIWMSVSRQDYLNTLINILDKAWNQNDQSMNAIEVSFKCCGYHSYEDYLSDSKSIPNSCCGSFKVTSICTESIYSSKPGCYDKFYDFWSTNFDVVLYTSIGIALVELTVFVFACCLTSGIRKSKN